MWLQQTGRQENPYKQYRNRTIIMCLVIVVVFFLFFRNRMNEAVYVLPGEDAISITGDGGEEISVSYQDIIAVALLENIDFGEIVDGTDTRRGTDGLWRNEIWGEYYLITGPKAKKYIVLTTKENIVVFNYENTSVTEELYYAFYDLMVQKGFAGQIRFSPSAK